MIITTTPPSASVPHRSPTTKRAYRFAAAVAAGVALTVIGPGSVVANALPRPNCEVDPTPGCEIPVPYESNTVVILPDPAHGYWVPELKEAPPPELAPAPPSPCTTPGGSC